MCHARGEWSCSQAPSVFLSGVLSQEGAFCLEMFCHQQSWVSESWMERLLKQEQILHFSPEMDWKQQTTWVVTLYKGSLALFFVTGQCCSRLFHNHRSQYVFLWAMAGVCTLMETLLGPPLLLSAWPSFPFGVKGSSFWLKMSGTVSQGCPAPCKMNPRLGRSHDGLLAARGEAEASDEGSSSCLVCALSDVSWLILKKMIFILLEALWCNYFLN